ncbi:MAG: 3'(2'),5'-bisphosphate nucleotidase CysQ [bacterium]|nr:3'(2'),5'-bisphosphate nucleotidase CysQ [Gammaproteobacteria bacterium]HIL98931.1 3'(2'),5'-bisphosphate nucleotidase [Pseudomonadales bacterium]
MEKLLEGISSICREAGQAILEVYDRDDFGIEIKSDQSPLTAADLAAQKIIVAGLHTLAPDIPVLSEESELISFETRQQWSRYFLVDPLDGTKEFINRNGEFTVNVALIDENRPILGVVYVPVQDVLYTGTVQGDKKSATVERDGQQTPISTRSMRDRSTRQDTLTIVASRRHGSGVMEECVQVLEEAFTLETRNIGSSLKFCLIAEGQADLYPRLAPTSEWDTGAAQAVVEAAGGSVVDAYFNPLQYNTKDNILNPFFYVFADPDFDWPNRLETVSKS